MAMGLGVDTAAGQASSGPEVQKRSQQPAARSEGGTMGRAELG